MTTQIRRIPFRHRCNRSAVSIITAVIGDQPHLLMIQRARREGDPWSGQMAFPGGRQAACDASILATARRETLEEVGIDPGTLTLRISRQSDVLTRSHHSWKPQVVTPFLFELDAAPELVTNHEASACLWVPARLFATPPLTLPWKIGPLTLALPCHYHAGLPIWGLSLQMIRDLQKHMPALFCRTHATQDKSDKNQ